MLYKNMVEICKLKDVYLRIFAVMCTDTELLERLSNGFPELFTDTKPVREGPIPLSALKKIASSLGEETSLDEVSHKYGLPSFSCAHPTSDMFKYGAIPMPQEIVDVYEFHVVRNKQGKGFPFDTDKVTIDGIEYYIGWINPSGVNADSEKDFYIFPCAYVDMNA
jgi:hypothetical protein